MNLIVRVLFILLSFALLTGCEDENQEGLTLDDVIIAGGGKITKFSATIEGDEFVTEEASGKKVDIRLTLLAVRGIESINLSMNRVGEGVYYGNNSIDNFISYRSESGIVYSSNKEGKASSAIIELARLDESKKQISGKFSGRLYSLSTSDSITIENGQFTRVWADLPFLGEMSADIDSIGFNSGFCEKTTSVTSGFTIETISSTANADTMSINVSFEEAIQEKEYNFLTDPISARYNSNTFSSNIFKNEYISESGWVRITKVDTSNSRVEGSFNFSAVNLIGESVLISNGQFKALIK